MLPLLLQIRTCVLNGDWEDVFRRWYSGFRAYTQPVSRELFCFVPLRPIRWHPPSGVCLSLLNTISPFAD